MSNPEQAKDIIAALWDGKQCLFSDGEYFILRPNLANTSNNYHHSRKLYKFDIRAARYRPVKGSMKDFFAKVIRSGNYRFKDLK